MLELVCYFLISMLVIGFDIIFFWVVWMMMMQFVVVGDVLFCMVYVYGLVCDEKGVKMLKLKGNVIDLLMLIDEYGVDVLCFMLISMVVMGCDFKLGLKYVEVNCNFVIKIWNVICFVEMNGVCGGVVWFDVKNVVNCWIIGEVVWICMVMDEVLVSYCFNDVVIGFYVFVWGKVCDWYVEFLKLLFDGEFVVEMQVIMGWVLDQCFIMLYLIMFFVIEELWVLIVDWLKMLVYGDWLEYGVELIDVDVDWQMNWVIQVIDNICLVCVQIGVFVGVCFDLIVIEVDVVVQVVFVVNVLLIEWLVWVNLSQVGVMGVGMILVVVLGVSFVLLVGEMIDVKVEIVWLEKLVGKIEKDVLGLCGWLVNLKFVENVGLEVIEEICEKLVVLEDDIVWIKGVLVQLVVMQLLVVLVVWLDWVFEK